MADNSPEMLSRILIASANPLFLRGLQKMVEDRWVRLGAEVVLAASMAKLFDLLDTWKPELVIVDCDDKSIQRADFLDHFIAGKTAMQVMLVSLKAGGEVVIYDRRVLTSEQAGEWLDLPPSNDL